MEPWSTHRKENRNNSCCRITWEVLKVSFCCCCNYTLCSHVVSSVAHRNHMEPSGINRTREKRCLCFDCYFTEPVHILISSAYARQGMVTFLVFVIKGPTRNTLNEEDCILDDSLRGKTVPSGQRRQDHKATTHPPVRRQRSNRKWAKESSRTCSSSEALLPKSSSTFLNSTCSWEPSVEKHKQVGSLCI